MSDLVVWDTTCQNALALMLLSQHQGTLPLTTSTGGPIGPEGFCIVFWIFNTLFLSPLLHSPVRAQRNCYWEKLTLFFFQYFGRYSVPILNCYSGRTIDLRFVDFYHVHLFSQHQHAMVHCYVIILYFSHCYLCPHLHVHSPSLFASRCIVNLGWSDWVEVFSIAFFQSVSSYYTSRSMSISSIKWKSNFKTTNSIKELKLSLNNDKITSLTK